MIREEVRMSIDIEDQDDYLSFYWVSWGVEATSCNVDWSSCDRSYLGFYLSSSSDGINPKAFTGEKDAKVLENFIFDMEEYLQAIRQIDEEAKVKTTTMFLIMMLNCGSAPSKVKSRLKQPMLIPRRRWRMSCQLNSSQRMLCTMLERNYMNFGMVMVFTSMSMSFQNSWWTLRTWIKLISYSTS